MFTSKTLIIRDLQNSAHLVLQPIVDALDTY